MSLLFSPPQDLAAVKIHDLQIDGFGVWSGLKLDALTDQLNVFYGPNEAGKTTLMQFVRAMLYGFSAERRGRYLPPLRGGHAGGVLEVSGPNGLYRVRRHDDDPREFPAGELTVLDRDGGKHGDVLLAALLCNVDEAIYNNVFAIGLREIQELGTLSNTAAADLLYKLTTGLDRVSLVDVLRELNSSRDRILSADGRPSLVAHLTSERDKLRGEIDELRPVTGNYARLVQQREQTHAEVARLEAESAILQKQVRAIEAAMAVRGNWLARGEMDQQLAGASGVPRIGEEVIRRLDVCNARIRRRRRRVRRAKEDRRQLREEAKSLSVNETIWRYAPRIEALAEQQTWIATLDNQAQSLEKEVKLLETQLSAEQERLGWTEQPKNAVRGSERAMAALQPAARTMRATRQRVQELKQQAQQGDETSQTLAGEIRTALAGRSDDDLETALDRVGTLVSQLRRRVKLDERLAAMTRHEKEQAEQTRELLDKQLLPVWMVAGLGGLFVMGVMSVIAGWFFSGQAATVLGGIVLIGGSVAGKFFLERSAANQLESAEKQLSLLNLQMEQAKAERDELDKQLPKGGGPLLTRLQNAEKELARLEELLAIDARRQAAEQESVSSLSRVEQALAAYQKSRRGWHQALIAAGLPENLSPKQVSQYTAQRGQIDELSTRLQRQREEWQQRLRERGALVERISQLMNELGVKAVSKDPADQIRQLKQSLAEQDSLSQRREALRRRLRKIRQAGVRAEREARRWRRRRRQLLVAHQAADETELRRRAVDSARWIALESARGKLSHEIQLALGLHATEDSVRELLATAAEEPLETRWEAAAARQQSVDEQLKTLFETRGQLQVELKQLGEDRRIAARMLELGTVEQQLEEALERWQVLATTHLVLDEVRQVYETDRQPETLQEASRHLVRLTRGQYVRVWTPLDENVLYVDDDAGHAVRAEVLSRGTREQLFLSLRLALVSEYRRRGVNLPLVLDDVLVNFDSNRAKAAALVLRDFAAEGHQLLVFTCHEHMVRMFRSLKIPTRTLPNNRLTGQSSPLELIPEEIEPPALEEPVVEAEPLVVARRLPELPVIELPLAEPVMIVEEPVAEPEPVAELLEETPEPDGGLYHVLDAPELCAIEVTSADPYQHDATEEADEEYADYSYDEDDLDAEVDDQPDDDEAIELNEELVVTPADVPLPLSQLRRLTGPFDQTHWHSPVSLNVEDLTAADEQIYWCKKDKDQDKRLLESFGDADWTHPPEEAVGGTDREGDAA